MYFFYGTWNSPHAAGNLRAFESGASGAGTTEKSLFIPHNKFSVRADIDGKGNSIPFVWRFRNEHTDVVSTDKTSYQGQDMNIRGRIDKQPQLPLALTFTDSFTVGAKGHSPRSSGAMPRKIWCITVFPTTVISMI